MDFLFKGEEEIEELKNLLIPKHINEYYSEITINLICITAIRFISIFLKRMKKTLYIFNDCNVKITLYSDHGDFCQGYIGSKIKFNQIILGETINRIKSLSVNLIFLLKIFFDKNIFFIK